MKNIKQILAKHWALLGLIINSVLTLLNTDLINI